jgi:hypothetical protein
VLASAGMLPALCGILPDGSHAGRNGNALSSKNSNKFGCLRCGFNLPRAPSSFAQCSSR